MKIPINAAQPNVPAGVSRMPGSSGSPPSLMGAVVVAIVSIDRAIPRVADRMAQVPKPRPIRISTAFSVSVAATERRPPIEVSSRIARKAKTAYS